MAYDYGYLEDSIKEYLHRGDASIVAQIPQFVSLAEILIDRELRVREGETRSPITITDAFYDIPTDYLEMRAIHVTVPQGRHAIPQVTPQVLDNKYSSATGYPKAFAIHGNEFEFRPGADSAGSPPTTYDVELSYYKKLTALTTPGVAPVSTTTNDILTNYPLLYLAACLIQAYLFVQDMEQRDVWIDVFTSQVATANATTNAGHYVNPRVVNIN